MLKKRHKKFYTITDVLNLVSGLEQKAKKMPEIIGFRSADTCKTFKDLLTLCNSLSIVFLQYELVQDTLIVLKIATETDSNLCKFGTVLDRLWQNRILTYNNLAFLHYKTKQFGESLKFLYEAHGISQSIKESGGITNSDLSITTNSLTFMLLWKMKRFDQAEPYLEISTEILQSISSGNKQSRLAESSIQSLFGIFSVFTSGLALKQKNSLKQALFILENSLSQIDTSNLPVRNIVKDQIKYLHKRKSNSVASDGSYDLTPNENLSKDPSDIFNTQLTPSLDWLITKEIETLYFITCFVPFISSSTPLIRVSELEKAKKNLQNGEPIKEAPELEEFPDLPSLKQQPRLSLDRKASPSSRPVSKLVPWWEKKVENRYQSEPRGNSYSTRGKSIKKSLPYKLNLKNSMVSKHIMIEFNPLQGNNNQIELLPVPPSSSKINSIDYFYEEIYD